MASTFHDRRRTEDRGHFRSRRPRREGRRSGRLPVDAPQSHPFISAVAGGFAAVIGEVKPLRPGMVDLAATRMCGGSGTMVAVGFEFLPSGTADVFLDLAGSLAFGVAAVWLLAPQLARSHRFLTFLCLRAHPGGLQPFQFFGRAGLGWGRGLTDFGNAGSAGHQRSCDCAGPLAGGAGLPGPTIVRSVSTCGCWHHCWCFGL